MLFLRPRAALDFLEACPASALSPELSRPELSAKGWGTGAGGAACAVCESRRAKKEDVARVVVLIVVALGVTGTETVGSWVGCTDAGLAVVLGGLGVPAMVGAN